MTIKRIRRKNDPYTNIKYPNKKRNFYEELNYKSCSQQGHECV